MGHDGRGTGVVIAAMGMVTLASGLASAQTAAPETGQRSTEFRAVEGGTEMVSGGTLLVEAYCAIWIILLGFLLISWRRQARIDARVDELEKALARSGAK
ncbi:MAG TPA: CcmD family protein [Polyangiaceae bacterium]|jgi:CcmD family protein|nr:CcmD family protein [Polyangiaceae bacterium]